MKRLLVMSMILMLLTLVIYGCDGDSNSDTPGDTAAKWGSAKWGEGKWNE